MLSPNNSSSPSAPLIGIFLVTESLSRKCFNGEEMQIMAMNHGELSPTLDDNFYTLLGRIALLLGIRPPNMCPVQVRIWEIPEGGLKRNMTEAVLELYGHSRRVGLVEWHPTTNNILFSAGYDYKVSPGNRMQTAPGVQNATMHRALHPPVGVGFAQGVTP